MCAKHIQNYDLATMYRGLTVCISHRFTKEYLYRLKVGKHCRKKEKPLSILRWIGDSDDL